MTLRFRSRGKLSSTGSVTTNAENYTGCTPSPMVVTGTFPQILSGRLEQMTDNVTPNYRRRVARGEILPVNNLQYDGYELQVLEPGQGVGYIQDSPLACNSPALKYRWRYGGNILGFRIGSGAHGLCPKEFKLKGLSYFPVPALTEKECSDLIIEVSTSVMAKRGQADNNLFESLAEYRQTFDLLLHPLRTFQKVLFDPKRNALSKVQKTAADAWLVYRYGVKPLISDVSAILEGLKKQVGLKRKTTRVSKTIKRNGSLSVVTNFDNVLSSTIETQIFDSFTVRAFSLDEYVADVLTNIGLTTKGLLGVPWELVPYSFVADWFANIGDVIYASAPAPGFKTLSAGYSTLRETGNYIWPTNTVVTNPNYSLDLALDGAISAFHRRKTRSSLGAPGFVIKSDFRFDKVVRVADAFALTAQKLDQLVRRI